MIFVFIMFDFIQYKEFVGVADAGGGCVKFDAGTVGTVLGNTPPCSITPAGACTCPLIYTPEFAQSCVGYLQVSVVGTQYGAMTYAVPTVFSNYRGGGMMIKTGDQFIYCGTTNAMPIVWGAPGAGAKRIQKVLDFYDYAVAFFKEK